LASWINSEVDVSYIFDDGKKRYEEDDGRSFCETSQKLKKWDCAGKTERMAVFLPPNAEILADYQITFV
jgi:hypothetical protein